MDSIHAETNVLWEINKEFDKDGEVVGFIRKLKKMRNDYEEIVFWISENSNERLMDIKRMSHGDRIRLQQRINKRINEQKKSQGRGKDEF